MINLDRHNYSIKKKMTSTMSQIRCLFSGNAEERAFCFFIFWTKVSGEDLQSTLTVRFIHRSRTHGNKEQVYKRKESILRRKTRKKSLASIDRYESQEIQICVSIQIS